MTKEWHEWEEWFEEARSWEWGCKCKYCGGEMQITPFAVHQPHARRGRLELNYFAGRFNEAREHEGSV